MSARIPALALAAILTAGCATTQQPLLVSYASLRSVHDLYLGTAGSMKVLCDGGSIDKKTCQGWAGFQDEFGKAYGLAGSGWMLAASGSDGGSYDLGPVLAGLGAYTQLIADTIAKGGH